MARIKSSIVSELAEAIGTEEFVVVELTKDGPVPVYDGDGNLLKFGSGDIAARRARDMTTKERKFQPRRVKDDKWTERERQRFTDKQYQHLPWSSAVWWRAHEHIHGGHFPHVSTKNSVGLMAYTENAEKGAADVQTPIKPGKYLEKYFAKVLDPYIIRDLCSEFSNRFEDNCLLFAETEDEFEELYTKGPTSCMSHATEKYSSHIHPVRVYAAGDLKLAYMKRDGRIVARTLVFPEKKVYSRIYGDSGRIQPLLTAAGFKGGPPVGAKLQRVITWQDKKKQTGNVALVMPHIDDVSFVTDEGTHLLIGNPSQSPAPKNMVRSAGAAGLSEWISCKCEGCGKETTNSGLTNVICDFEGNNQRMCAKCIADTDKVVTCSRSGARVLKKAAVQMYNGEWWWSHEYNARGFKCSGDGKLYPMAMRTTYKDATGKSKAVSTTWFAANKGRACKTCGAKVIEDCGALCQSKYIKQQEFTNQYVSQLGTQQWYEIPEPRRG